MGHRICIIGGGPAGLSAGYMLAKKGCSVDVFELSDSVGGMCKTFPLWGYQVDLGPHRFVSKDKKVNSLWLEMVGHEYKMVHRKTRIYYEGKYFGYPLKGIEALAKLGAMEGFHCLFSYLYTKVKGSKDEDDFESWTISRFGKRLFEIFFKTYSEKLWGIDCKDLDSDFASQRIRKLSLGEALKGILGIGQKKHATLADQFAYPIKGTGYIYNQMAEKIEELGSHVHLGQCVQSFIRGDDGQAHGVRLANGQELEYDFVISTMPLTLLVKALSQPEDPIRNVLKKLSYRNTILVYTLVNKKDIFDDQWLYIHSADVGIGRVTNYNNWVDDITSDKDHTVLCSELWCNDDGPMWKENDETIIQKVDQELEAIGLIDQSDIIEGKVIRIPRSYPVYKKGYKEPVSKIEAFLKDFENVIPIGRYGTFKYNNQDHSILMGILISENICDGKSHELWRVNTDYETYQESASITSSGLATDKDPKLE
ncbi:MAG: UDP-galactopyranose mutase [Opitutaceae bacterium]|nr:UDP-galactopyranose mutase [Opitutaceae bacterium]|tara:strand:- start:3539 stop:4981 length:1443 start_codon:yes stop_codon:yes gene_type:complete